MKFKKIIATSSLAIALTTVSNTNIAHADGGKLIGTLLGAAGGAAVGSNVGKGKGNIVAIAVGTLLGAGVGKSIGNSVDHHNSYHYRNTSSYYHPTNNLYSPTHYTEPHYQSVTYGNGAPHTYTNSITTISMNTQMQQYCREFINSVTIGGKIQESYGTACRQPDGSWKIKN